MKKRLLLIENTQAGKKRLATKMPEALRAFMDAGYEVDLCQTKQHGDAGRFAAQFGASHDLIVCIGGDGTFNDTVGGMVRGGIETPLGYIPTGSSNDFAGSLSLPRDPLAAAQNIVNGRPRRVDLVRFDKHLFSNAAEFGAFTWLGYTTPQIMKNAMGPTAYVLGGIRDLPKIRPEQMTAAANGKTCGGSYIFGAICNTTRMGAVALPPGLEAPDDGKFEVLLVRQPNTLTQWQQTISGVLDKSYPPEFVDFFCTDRLHIESNSPVHWCLDGEKLVAPLSLEVQAVPRAFSLMTGG